MASVETSDSSVLNSKLAVKILRRIAVQDEGDYGSSIADSLNKSQASVGRVIGDLNDIGFVEKGKREKAQYYEIDYDNVSDFWYRKVVEELEEVDDDLKREKYLGEGYTTKDEMLSGLKENEGSIKRIVAAYLERVLQSDVRIERYTVSDLLFESVGFSVGHNIIQDDQLLERYPYLREPIDALVYLWKMDGFPKLFRETLSQEE
ncbi:hypothetical protein [Candidatus Nanohalobium constans]|uniref:Uncharacterized protein n=1 Tax=Candidatus Nanohalobium constans TaxID=2565781 RepID=A0A5Q0UHV6_9ARCH|nr:hypothetical protein [Candidatus Nanohalobium constans]QGA80515.1 hypothetical protein LC1Nh_0622 [Candidatus Nanohalobium constans]